MNQITVIGGGLAGLTAAISCAEGGADRAAPRGARPARRAGPHHGPYKANLGPHAIYSGGVLWDWLAGAA